MDADRAIRRFRAAARASASVWLRRAPVPRTGRRPGARRVDRPEVPAPGSAPRADWWQSPTTGRLMAPLSWAPARRALEPSGPVACQSGRRMQSPQKGSDAREKQRESCRFTQIRCAMTVPQHGDQGPNSLRQEHASNETVRSAGCQLDRIKQKEEFAAKLSQQKYGGSASCQRSSAPRKLPPRAR